MIQLITFLLLSLFFPDDKEQELLLSVLPEDDYKQIAYFDIETKRKELPEEILSTRYGIKKGKYEGAEQLPGTLANRWSARAYASRIKVTFKKLNSYKEYLNPPQGSFGQWTTDKGTYAAVTKNFYLAVYRFENLSELMTECRKKFEILPILFNINETQIFIFKLDNYDKPLYCTSVDDEYFLVADQKRDLIRMCKAWGGELPSIMESSIGKRIKDVSDQLGSSWYMINDEVFWEKLIGWLQKDEPHSEYINMAEEELEKGCFQAFSDVWNHDQFCEKEFYFFSDSAQALKKKKELSGMNGISFHNDSLSRRSNELAAYKKNNTSFKIENNILIKTTVIDLYYLQQKEELLNERAEIKEERERKKKH